MLPTFIVIGAGKAGTTSLWGYLRDHPQVFMSDPKELDFFTVEHNWSKGVGWYEAHFADAGDAVARGEASGSYTNWPNFAGRWACPSFKQFRKSKACASRGLATRLLLRPR